MRVLAISSPSTTHFMPAVPLLWALRAAGHEVLFAGQPDVVGMARGAGLPTVTIGHLFDALGAVSALPEGKRPLEAGLGQIPKGMEAQAVAAWVFHAKYMAHPYLDFARTWQPDLIVTDPLEYAGLLVGGALGIPVVHHRWSSETVTPVGLNLARLMLGRQAQQMGAADGVPLPALTLDPYPAAWAVPGVPAGQPIRPVPYNGGGPTPDWALSPTTRRRVCVTFGMATVQLNGLPLVRHVAEAFDGLHDIEAVITLDDEHREEFGRTPHNVTLVAPAPLTTFVDTCDAVIHHGGAGTATTTLMAGLPHLLLPQMLDQFARCEQIAESGAAISVPAAADQDDPDVVRAAITSLLDEPQYRETAAKLRTEAEQLPSPADITTRLEHLVRQSGAASNHGG